jgi:predicted DNA-binding protein (MmcQ/YjbR family)
MRPLTKALRAHALRYPETREDFPWEGDRVIKVRKKIFLFLGEAGIGLKLTHSNQAALGLPYVKPMAYGLGRSGWVSIALSQSRKPSADLLKSWIDESYRAVAPKTIFARLKD